MTARRAEGEKRRVAFRECDLKRALKVAQALKAGQVRIDPQSGQIIIEPLPEAKSSRLADSQVPEFRL